MQIRRSLITPMLSVALLMGSGASFAFVTVGVSITVAPPVLPVYQQPALPAPGYIWSPGYWAYDEDAGYYWVPGTWVLPPEPGLLWTPGYWGWVSGVYAWNAGYWGPEVGFYGGVNYGFGYTGVGFAGGYWAHGTYFYNRSVNNFGGVHVTNVYNKTVINHVTINRVSFNGGSGGIQARPTQAELAAGRAHHVAPVAAQERQEQAAHGNPQLRASMNHGHPAIAATARAGVFSGHGVVAARYSTQPTHSTESRGAAAHPMEQPAQHHNTAASPAGQEPRAPVRENSTHTSQAHPAHPAVEHAAPARHAEPSEHAAPHAPTEHAPAEHANDHASARPAARPADEHANARRSSPHPSEHPNQHAASGAHNDHRPG